MKYFTIQLIMLTLLLPAAVSAEKKYPIDPVPAQNGLKGPWLKGEPQMSLKEISQQKKKGAHPVLGSFEASGTLRIDKENGTTFTTARQTYTLEDEFYNDKLNPLIDGYRKNAVDRFEKTDKAPFEKQVKIKGYWRYYQNQYLLIFIEKASAEKKSKGFISIGTGR